MGQEMVGIPLMADTESLRFGNLLLVGFLGAIEQLLGGVKCGEPDACAARSNIESAQHAAAVRLEVLVKSEASSQNKGMHEAARPRL